MKFLEKQRLEKHNFNNYKKFLFFVFLIFFFAFADKPFANSEGVSSLDQKTFLSFNIFESLGFFKNDISTNNDNKENNTLDFLEEREEKPCDMVDDGAIYCENETLGNVILDIDPKEENKENILKFKKISFSNDFNSSCLISNDNVLYCRGNVLSFYKEQISQNTYYKKIEGVNDVVDASIGKDGDFACVVTKEGNAFCFGSGENGKLSNGSNDNKQVPTKVLDENQKAFKNAKSVSLGKNHGCIISKDNDLYCFGDNKLYQIGDREKEEYATLKKVKYFNKYVKSAHLGDNHTCVVLEDNSLSCFGGNEYGQLGDDTKENNDIPNVVYNGVSFVSTRKNTTCLTDKEMNLYCVGEGINSLTLKKQENVKNVKWVSVGTDEIYYQVPCYNAIKKLNTNEIIYKDSKNENPCCESEEYYKVENNEECEDEELLESLCLEQGHYACEGNKVICKVNEDKTKATKEICNDGIDNNCNGEIDEGCEDDLASISSEKISNIESFIDKNEFFSNGLKSLGKEKEEDIIIKTLDTPSYLENAMQVAAGQYHTCAIKEDWTVVCWGLNDKGQLGNNSNYDSPVPVQVVGGAQGESYLENITQVAGGNNHTCAVDESKNVYCWGRNNNGQLGNNSTTDSWVPVKVVGGEQGGSALENITQIASGGDYTCALDEGKNVYCWGDDSYGQLGNNSTTNSLVPVKVVGGEQGGSVLENITQVTGGEYHTCAVDESKNVYCWGWNYYGQLGNNSTTVSGVLAPVKVVGGEQGGSHLENITQIAGGYRHTCAVDESKNVYCWGYNNYGQLGNNSTTRSLVPVIVVGGEQGGSALENITQIASGGDYTCALDESKNVYCWGYNQYGQLGNNSTTKSKVPVKVVGGAQGGSVLENITQIASGGYHTCAVDESKNVYCWGWNNRLGPLGNNSTTDSSVPVRVVGGAQEGSALENIIQITGGSSHTCVLDESKDVYCWGENNNGQLGNNSTTNSSVPVRVVGGAQWGSYLENIMQISLGESHTCVLDESKDVYCWGGNNNGQLGNNSTTKSLVPVKVVGGAQGESVLENMTQISGGYYHTCALDEGKNVYCWGGNNNGQLGNNSTTDSRVPVKVVGGAQGGNVLENIIQITNGYFYACALDESKNVYCWGSNYYGQLGNNSTTNSSVPVKVVGGAQGGSVLENITQITGGNSHTCALDGSKNVYCWGYDSHGQLGNNSTTKSLVPVKVVGGAQGGSALENITQITNGYDHTCSLDGSKNVYCWGYNYNGQLGNNSMIDSSVPVKVVGGPQGGSALENITQITNGYNHTCSLDGNKNSYCWGKNYKGQLGNNSTADSSFPVKVFKGEQVDPIPTPTVTLTMTNTPTITLTMTNTPTITSTMTNTPTVTPTTTNTPSIDEDTVRPETVVPKAVVTEGDKRSFKVNMRFYKHASLKPEGIDPKATYTYRIQIRRVGAKSNPDGKMLLGKKFVYEKKKSSIRFLNLEKGTYSVRYQIVIKKGKRIGTTKWSKRVRVDID